MTVEAGGQELELDRIGEARGRICYHARAGWGRGEIGGQHPFILSRTTPIACGSYLISTNQIK